MNPTRAAIILGSALFLTVALVIADRSQDPATYFYRVHLGMTKADVDAVIGQPTGGGIGGGPRRAQWQTFEYGTGAITFVQGKVDQISRNK
jgi:hypothetical protein